MSDAESGATETTWPSYDPDVRFRHKARALLKGQEGGHLWPYHYDTARFTGDRVDGAHLYRLFQSEPQYYLYEEEAHLITERRADIAAVANIMWRIQRDCQAPEMLADAFEYRIRWVPDSFDLQHCVVATRPQRFRLMDEELALPGYGHVFEYVSRGAAWTTPAARTFLERHLAHRGDSGRRVAEQVIELRRAI